MTDAQEGRARAAGPGGEPSTRPTPAPRPLTPSRPWARGPEQAGSSSPQAPQPSNPDVVLHGLAAELGAELGPDRPAETEDERRRRFARQHAAADAARLAAAPPPSALDARGAPPSSYEPDPAVYDVPDADDEGPRRRRFALRRRGSDDGTPPAEGTPAEGTPAEGAPAEPGVLGRAVRWLTVRSADPATSAATPGGVTRRASAVLARGRHAVRRRRGAGDEEDGPFFPPEAAQPAAADEAPTAAVEAPAAADEAPAAPDAAPAAVADGAHARPRPRPRPAAAAPTPPPAGPLPLAPERSAPARHRPRPRPPAARAAASPAAETPTEPDPAGSPDPSNHRSPDISRFLTATEPGSADAAGDAKGDGEKPERRRMQLRGSRGLRVLTKLGIVALVGVAAAVVLRIYVVAPYYIPSASMEPTLHGGTGTNDRILVDKITYRIHDPHQGDIVVFDRPDTWHVTDTTLVKRIIGLPGDIVSLRAGLVYVNGQRLTENYLNKNCGPAPTKPLTRTTRWTVPMDDYFVMGDNRCDSDDSRMYGPIPQSTIVGRAFLIIWPLSRFGTP